MLVQIAARSCRARITTRRATDAQGKLKMDEANEVGGRRTRARMLAEVCWRWAARCRGWRSTGVVVVSSAGGRSERARRWAHAAVSCIEARR